MLTFGTGVINGLSSMEGRKLVIEKNNSNVTKTGRSQEKHKDNIVRQFHLEPISSLCAVATTIKPDENKEKIKKKIVT